MARTLFIVFVCMFSLVVGCARSSKQGDDQRVYANMTFTPATPVPTPTPDACAPFQAEDKKAVALANGPAGRRFERPTIEKAIVAFSVAIDRLQDCTWSGRERDVAHARLLADRSILEDDFDDMRNLAHSDRKEAETYYERCVHEFMGEAKSDDCDRMERKLFKSDLDRGYTPNQ